MNAKQKLHQLKLQQWADICKQQISSGLSVKDWCLENNISIHTYYYWKHLLKQEYLDSVLPDIAPLSDCQSGANAISPVITDPATASHPTLEHNSNNLCNSLDSGNSISIYIGDILIHIGESVSEELLFWVLKAVRHA